MPTSQPADTMQDELAGELAREQAFLDDARAQLGRMRELAESLDSSKASDAISGEVLGWVLARRIASLQDDPRTTLFFGRIDVDPADGPAEQFHIGRRHVSDEAGDPVVVDWRAPISTAFYRASPLDPMDVVLRRRFGVDRGRLTAIEDEHLREPDRSRTSAGSLLAAEIERPRTGPMRDIVSTIQPEQDEIVRSDVAVSVCVQGAPGTGRRPWGCTEPRGCSTPSASGSTARVCSWSAPTAPSSTTSVPCCPPSARYACGTPRSRPCSSTTAGSGPPSRPPSRPSRATRASRRYCAGPCGRPSSGPLRRSWSRAACASGACRHTSSGSSSTSSPRGACATRRRATCSPSGWPTTCSSRWNARVTRRTTGSRTPSRSRRPSGSSSVVVWPALDPQGVLHRLWSDADALKAAAGDDLTADEQAMLLWHKPARTKGSARWSRADLALLDELDDLLRRTPSLGHIVLDEAQDLSPMQLRAVGRRCSTGSVTVLGDIAQGTTPWATGSSAEAMRHLGKPEHDLVVLDRGFRVPAAVIEYAARLLPAMAPGLGAPVSVRENPGRLEIRPAQAGDLEVEVVRAVETAAAGPGSVGVIAPDAGLDRVSAALGAAGIAHGRLDRDHGDDEDHQVEVVPASVAKGLEFDHTVVVEPAAIAAAEPDERTGLRRLYVVLTRAVSELTIVHAEPLPAALLTA
ncbi:HelD family protein [Terrabacter sp. BE26]|uniref:HelD family protein n=1 Tax=Terrabacter sp. BE26 TaxID=2898152 RepID=UPI0035BE195B